ncbi:MAG: immunoglobulin domain-containing protein, partial [Verrucomicrobia bacterium]|nr:immunoglobulin domain-containing protein [Verrucomicrobiota bacterium]
MKAQLIPLLGLMAGGLLLPGAASASVVTVSYYRMGEQDPGAVAGNPANAIAVDSGGAAVTNNLQRLGVAPTYAANTGVNGSTLCLAVAGGGYTNGAPLLALTDNWGIEAWVSAASLSSDGYAQIAYNGNSGPSGMGLYASPAGQYFGLVGGKAFVGGAPVELNTWTHLAMVVADGTTTFYVNGVANGTGPAPNTPTGFFGIGTNPSKPGGWEQFHGSIDEVRVFMVVPGTFTTDDLLLTSVPPPPEPAVILSGPTAFPGNQLAYGSALSLTVLAGGTAPIQYQWWQGTSKVPGATNATLSFSSVTATNAGSYSVVVGNAYGPATTSAVVNVTVIVPSVTGSVIPVAYYRLGENDPGAADGQVGAATTVDAVSGLNLSVVGDSSTYSANTGVHGSTLSLAVDGAGGYNFATPIITNSGNWGLEAWVMSTNADNGGQGAVVLNGDFTAGNGLGIFQRGTQWQGLVTGLAWIGGARVVPNTWTHLAIVASASNTTFFVNGVANGTGPVPKPATSGDFSIGYDIYNGTPNPFQGLIDEVRAFTVLGGQFAVNDLLLNQAPPAPQAPSVFSGPTITPAAILSVSNGPAYLSGQSLSIGTVFAGTSPLHFQWRQGTNLASGATNATLSFNSLTTNNSGNYTVVVTNVYGAITSSVATVTVLPPGLYPVAYYRLGENDPGAANGQVANPQTVDFAGSVNLWQLGEPPTYTNNTGVAGSTLCIAANGGGYTNGAPFALNGNWGIEAWAKADVAAPTLSGNGYSQIAYNGNSGPGGMGLYQTPSGTFVGLCGGVALVGGSPVVPGTWTHLAMVYAGGATTFYVNGVAAGTGPAPNPPPNFFGVGINPSGAGGGEPFQGSIDEVRVFTFSPGYFAVNDLLLNQVPPGHEAAAVLSGPTLSPGPTVLSGSSLSMSVQAVGTSPLQFQWFHNGTPIPGATTASLSLTNVTASASGVYYVTVTNAYGSGTSPVATVTVFPPGSGGITEIAYYSLGENDPGAANGQAGNATTVDR